MSNKISNFVFLILLFLLQSCSGGKIGNFLESSFRNNNSNKVSQNEIDQKLKSEIISKENILLKEKVKITKIKSNDENKLLNVDNSLSIKTNNPNTKKQEKQEKQEKQNYSAKTYRVYVILKKVDPSFPTENFSRVLRNGDINFLIEKIELIPELNENKK